MTEQQNEIVRKAGRPAGQFAYHKLCVLKYLQEVVQSTGKPFEGSNDDLSMCMGQWGKRWRVGVSPRQVARYLRSLQEESLQGSNTPRIEVFYKRGGSDGTRRLIVVNDMNPIKLF